MNYEDANTIEYYWNKNENISQYIENPEFQKNAPELCAAYAAFLAAKRLVGMEIRELLANSL